MKMQKVIEIDNLVKRYKNSNTNAVDGVSFDVREGELFAFLGVNGAGKSTLINILCTLISKSNGNVKVCGYDIDKQGEDIRRSIGVVFQNNVMDAQLSVFDNLAVRATFYNLNKIQIKERIDQLSGRLGMADYLNRPYGKLSGGQRRKCDIARALVANPRILFLDEPTTGLDPQSRIDMWNVIQDIQKQFHTTVFMSTHYMEEVNIADRVAIIDKGRLLCLDTPQSLKSAYSRDTVRLTIQTGARSVVEERIKTLNLPYSFSSDTFTIHIKNAVEVFDTIYKLKMQIKGLEIIKGDMDSVFLNVVGRRFDNE
jgi:ABC-type multidrug transport system ATPase subunit